MYSFKSIGAKSRSVSEIGFTINFGVVRIEETAESNSSCPGSG